MASDRQKGQNMMHMPTKEEFEKIIRERREKYSTSKDLGFRQFGQDNRKADFTTLLKEVIEPDMEKKAEEKEKMKEAKEQGSTNSNSSGTGS